MVIKNPWAVAAAVEHMPQTQDVVDSNPAGALLLFQSLSRSLMKVVNNLLFLSIVDAVQLEVEQAERFNKLQA